MLECEPRAWRCKILLCMDTTTQSYDRQLPERDLFYDSPPQQKRQGLVEGVRPMGDEGAAALLHAVGERETETWGKQLLDVWTPDILRLGDLNNPEDLKTSTHVGQRCHIGRKPSDERGQSGSGHGAWQPCPGKGS